MTDDITEQVHDLHSNGIGRNEIARRLKVNPARVTATARRLGLSFDRAATASATAASTADTKARRAALAAKLLDLIEDETNALVKLGPAGTVADADRRGRAIASIARAAADVARTIPTTSDTDEAIGMLDELAEGFKVVVALHRAELQPD